MAKTAYVPPNKRKQQEQEVKEAKEAKEVKESGGRKGRVSFLPEPPHPGTDAFDSWEDFQEEKKIEGRDYKKKEEAKIVQGAASDSWGNAGSAKGSLLKPFSSPTANVQDPDEDEDVLDSWEDFEQETKEEDGKEDVAEPASLSNLSNLPVHPDARIINSLIAKDRHAPLLTSVQLGPQTMATVVNVLGTGYDLRGTLESRAQEGKLLNYKLHQYVCKLLNLKGDETKNKVFQALEKLLQWDGKSERLKSSKSAQPQKAQKQNVKVKQPKKPAKPEADDSDEADNSDEDEKVVGKVPTSLPSIKTGVHLIKELLLLYPCLTVAPPAQKRGEHVANLLLQDCLKDYLANPKNKGALNSLGSGLFQCLLPKAECMAYEALQKQVDEKKRKAEDKEVAEEFKGQPELLSWIEENEARKGDSKLVFNPWQLKLIDNIVNNVSSLVCGPPGVGKTFMSSVAIYELLDESKQYNFVDLLHCTPTFHTALQAYINLSKTFPRTKISLITGDINIINDNTKIWIGTPAHLWSYFRNRTQEFSIGIFDEVHTISTSYAKTYESLIRAEAQNNLLKLCTKQVIALSATIYPGDIELLLQHLRARTGIQEIQLITYKERAVPLNKYIYDNYNERVMLQTLETKIKKKEAIPLVPITPESTFGLLKEMSKREQLPVLLFDENEEACFQHFTAFVNHLKNIEERAYPSWHALRKLFFEELCTHNERLKAMQTTYAGLSDTARLKRKGEFLEAIKENKTFLGRICQALWSAIEEIKNNIAKGTVGEDLLLATPEGLQEILGRRATAELLDLYKEYSPLHKLNFSVEEVTSEGLAPLPIICDGVGPHYLLSRPHPDLGIMKLLRTASASKDRKLWILLRNLCKAEKLKIKDVDGLLDLLEKGLMFGCGIILPTMPFAIQYEMLRLLGNKRLSVVFASHSFAAGVNYPFRSVVVRSNTLRDYNVCDLIQMEGRCGRRRLDNQAHVVYWNIANAVQISPEYLPRITFPDEGAKGMYISNPLEVAIKIEKQRLLLDKGVMKVVGADLQGENKKKEGEKSWRKDGEDVKKEGKDAKGAAEDNNEGGLSLTGDNILNIRKHSFEQTTEACLLPMIGFLPENEYLNLNEPIVRALALRVQYLATKQYDSVRERPYYYAELLNILKKALQEVHTEYHLGNSKNLLTFMSLVYRLLHRVQYRQLSPVSQVEKPREKRNEGKSYADQIRNYMKKMGRACDIGELLDKVFYMHKTSRGEVEDVLKQGIKNKIFVRRGVKGHYLYALVNDF